MANSDFYENVDLFCEDCVETNDNMSGSPEVLRDGVNMLIALPGGKAAIWKYFGFITKDGRTVDPTMKNRIYCRIPGCFRAEMAYSGNTSNMASHLRRFHPKESDEIQKARTIQQYSVNSTDDSMPLLLTDNAHIWKYFSFQSHDGKMDAENKVYCRIEGCPRSAMPYSGNVINLAGHLSCFHPAENAELLTLLACDQMTPISNAVNRATAPSAMVTKAAVWKYFGFRSLNDKLCRTYKHNVVFCQIPGCLKNDMAIVRNDSNMMSHLQVFHPKEYLELFVLVEPVAIKLEASEASVVEVGEELLSDPDVLTTSLQFEDCKTDNVNSTGKNSKRTGFYFIPEDKQKKMTYSNSSHDLMNDLSNLDNPLESEQTGNSLLFQTDSTTGCGEVLNSGETSDLGNCASFFPTEVLTNGSENTVCCQISGCNQSVVCCTGNASRLNFHPQYSAFSYEKKETVPSKSLRSSLMVTNLKCRRGRIITEAIINYIIDLRSFDIVQNSGFRSLMMALVPDYPLAATSYYLQRTLNKHRFVTDQLRTLISPAFNVSLTVDLWLSSLQTLYLCLSVNFVRSEDSSLQSRFLECLDVSQECCLSASWLSNTLKKRLSHWGLPAESAVADRQITAITVVNCMHSESVVNTLPICYEVICLDHTVSVGVEKALKTSNIRPLLEKVELIVRHFETALSSVVELKNVHMISGKGACNNPLVPPSFKTRWPNIYEVLKWLIEMSDSIHFVLTKSDQEDVRRLALSPEEFFHMQELWQAMTPLFHAMQGIEGERFPSISLLEPALHRLKEKCLTVTDDQIAAVHDFRGAVLTQLDEHYSSPDIQSLMAQATLLDPRFKDFHHIRNRTERAERLSFAKSELTANPILTRIVSSYKKRKAPTSKMKTKCQKHETSSFMNFLSSSQTDSEDEEIDDKQISIGYPTLELCLYSSEPVDTSTDPMIYWKNATIRFPILSQIALTLLTISVLRLSCEKLFSNSGLNDRTFDHFSSEQINVLLCLHENKDLL